MFSMADNFLTMDADSQANDIVSDKSDLHKVTREGDYVPNTAKVGMIFLFSCRKCSTCTVEVKLRRDAMTVAYCV